MVANDISELESTFSWLTILRVLVNDITLELISTLKKLSRLWIYNGMVMLMGEVNETK